MIEKKKRGREVGGGPSLPTFLRQVPTDNCILYQRSAMSSPNFEKLVFIKDNLKIKNNLQELE